MAAAAGLHVSPCETGGWVCAQNPKPSRSGSVSGVPCETAVWGDIGKWGVRVNDIEAAGGLHVCQCEAGGQDLSKKHETERSWLGFGRAVRNGSVG